MSAKVHPLIVSAAQADRGRRPLRRARYHNRVTAGHASANWSNLRTVFLDRDGVLNRKAPEGEYVARWEDFEVLDGAIEALGRLHRAGLRSIVVTNQRGIALGRYSEADVEAIHAKFQELLAASGAPLDAVYVCPHDRGECNCRKPLPGLFERAAAEFPGVSAAESVMIGDSFADMEFGKRLGMRTILIETGGDEAGGVEASEVEALDKVSAARNDKAGQMADFRCSSLQAAVEEILGPTRSSK
jgi:D-glycero-D-manno-heptose 1,7-bisphosphate phosphatase